MWPSLGSLRSKWCSRPLTSREESRRDDLGPKTQPGARLRRLEGGRVGGSPEEGQVLFT